MKLPVDSTEPLEDVLRVLGALYDVELVIAADRTAMPSEAGPGQVVRISKQRSRTRSSTARIRGGKSRVQRATTTAKDNFSRSARVAANAEVRAGAQQNGMNVSD